MGGGGQKWFFAGNDSEWLKTPKKTKKFFLTQKNGRRSVLGGHFGKFFFLSLT